MSLLTAEISDLDFSNVVALEGTMARQFYREISQPGSGAITFRKDAPQLAEVIEGEKIVTFYFDGVAVQSILVDPVERHPVNQGEAAAETTTVNAPGHLRMFKWAGVNPALGSDAVPSDDTRRLNWTASAYDDSGPEWVGATEVCKVSVAKAGWLSVLQGATFAAGFYDDDASVLFAADATIDGAGAGTCWMRSDVWTNTDAGWFLVEVVADNWCQAFVNGVLLIDMADEGTLGSNFMATHTQMCKLPAGDFVFSGWCRNENLVSGNNPGNPAGFALSVHPVDATGLVGASVFHTSTNWKIVEYSDDPPLMTWGEGAIILLEEMVASGVLPGMSWTWTKTLDSAGNDWPAVTDVSTGVETSLDAFFAEAGDTDADIVMTPGALEVNAYVFGTLTGPTPSAMHVVENTQQSIGVQARRVWAKWDGGWHKVERAGDGDWREMVLQVGNTSSLYQVDRVVNAQLDLWSRIQTEISLGVAPILPSGDYPENGFGLGSIIPAAICGSDQDERVRAYGATEVDEDGTAVITITLRDVLREAQEKTLLNERKMLKGGGTNVSQPVTTGGSSAGSGGAPQLAGFSSQWVDYLPVWSGQGGSDPDLGNGSLTGKYRVWTDGKIDAVVIDLRIGSTTDLGTHEWWTFSMPQRTDFNRSFGDNDPFDDLPGMGLGPAWIWGADPEFFAFNPNERERTGVTMTADYAHTSASDPALLYAVTEQAALADYGDPPAIYTQALRWSPTWPVDNAGDPIWTNKTRARLAIFGFSDLTGD